MFLSHLQQLCFGFKIVFWHTVCHLPKRHERETGQSEEDWGGCLEC